MKPPIRCYCSTFVNSAVNISCDSAGTVVVPGLLALASLHLTHRPFSLPLLSNFAVRFLGQELTLVFCVMFYTVDLGCVFSSSCVVIKIMGVCLGGRGEETRWSGKI